MSSDGPDCKWAAPISCVSIAGPVSVYGRQLPFCRKRRSQEATGSDNFELRLPESCSILVLAITGDAEIASATMHDSGENTLASRYNRSITSAAVKMGCETKIAPSLRIQSSVAIAHDLLSMIPTAQFDFHAYNRPILTEKERGRLRSV